MKSPTRRLGSIGPLALVLALAGACAASAATISPLPRSEYTVRAACGAPAPRSAGCLAEQLIPRTQQANARTHPLGIVVPAGVPARSPAAGDFGLRPRDLHSAYALPTAAPSSQTIAIVDAYNDPTAEADLAAYDEEFALPACTVANGCFAQVGQTGSASALPFPASVAQLEAARNGSTQERARAAEATGWALEIALDIESAHATCQSCKILLVEAESPRDTDLEAAERTAESLGANEISNSFGGPEEGGAAASESTGPYNHPGTVITASAGDNGYLGSAAANPAARGYAEFPASSPHVISVGGTRLSLAAGGAWSAETVWNDSGEREGLREGFGAGGGGCSSIFAAPTWQLALSDWSAVGCAGTRSAADVSADADPYSGLAIHASNPECEYRFEGQVSHWCTIGGTSLASPVIAAVFALAGGAGATNYPAASLYANVAREPSSLHDIAAGSNGACAKPFERTTGSTGCSAAEEAAANCESQRICLAAPGYDGPSGLGTPDGLAAFGASVQGGPEASAGGEPEEEAPQANVGGEERVPTPTPPKGFGALGSPSGPAPAPVPIAPAPAGPPRITSLSLTRTAVQALIASRPRIARMGFSFTITAPARVRVILLRQARRGGRLRWSPAAAAFALTARTGVNSSHLLGRGHLGRGPYRITLVPSSGAARSVSFVIS